MIVLSNCEALLAFVAMFGARCRRPENQHVTSTPKHLTLYDALQHRHFVTDIEGEQEVEPAFIEALQRVFRQAGGGWLILRQPVRPHGVNGSRLAGPDRVLIFDIRGGRATKLSEQAVLLLVGRVAIPEQAEFYGTRKKWKSHDFLRQEVEEVALA